jgi:hypothetical protein
LTAVKFTRYEIQAFTATTTLDKDCEPVYEWVPLPELMLADRAERSRIARIREKDGRFRSLAQADEVYRLLVRERPGAILRLRKVVVQEVYTTLDGTDSDDEATVRRDRARREAAAAKLYPGVPCPIV